MKIDFPHFLMTLDLRNWCAGQNQALVLNDNELVYFHGVVPKYYAAAFAFPFLSNKVLVKPVNLLPNTLLSYVNLHKE